MNSDQTQISSVVVKCLNTYVNLIFQFYIFDTFENIKQIILKHYVVLIFIILASGRITMWTKWRGPNTLWKH